MPIKRRLAAAALTLSALGAGAIIQHEGWKNEAYRDIAGVWTICAGHTATARPGLRLSDAACHELLAKDTRDAQRAVQRLVKAPITQNQFDALTSFTFNVGTGALQTSTLLRKLNSGDCRGAANEFQRWNKARANGVLRPVQGLTTRRLAEAAVFRADCP